MELLEAVQKGDVNFLKNNVHLISRTDFISAESSVDVNVQMNETSALWPSFTALHIAVEYQHLPLIKLFLKSGADPNVPEKNGMTPLHLACGYSDFKLNHLRSAVNCENPLDIVVNSLECRNRIVLLLIENGAKVNAQDRAGRTPIFYLRDKKVNIFRSYIPMKHVTQKFIFDDVFRGKRVEIENALISQGADLKISDNDGLTFLHLLADSNDFEANALVHSLIARNKIDVNVMTSTGITPLHLASRLEIAEPMIGILLENGANPNVIETENHSTPLLNYVEMFLNSSKAGDMFRKFIQYGADVNYRLKNRKTILHTIFSRSSVSYRKFYYGPTGDNFSTAISPLFTLDCDINAQDLSGKTPLHYAAQFHDASDMELLLNQGADIDVIDENGKTPLNYCSDKNCLALEFLVIHVEKLKEIGCHVSEENLETAEVIKRTYLAKRKCIVKSEDDIENEVREINDLKNIALDRYNFLYGVLFKSPTELASYIKNPLFREVISDYNFRRKFPRFASIIKLQFKRGLSRSLLLEPAKESLIYLTNVHFPDTCSEYLLNLLDGRDVRRLIAAKPDSLL